jgi:hypothetical protein
MSLILSGCGINPRALELARQERLNSTLVDFANLPRGQMQAYLRQQLDKWTELVAYTKQVGGAIPTSGLQTKVGKGENADRALASIAGAAQDRNQKLSGQVRTPSTPVPPTRSPLQPMGTTMLYGASIGRSFRTVNLTQRQKWKIEGWTWQLTELVQRVESGESTQAEERETVGRIRERWQTVERWLSE